jgi:hypothetical protein
VIFLPAISYGAGWLFVQIFPNLPFWVEGISPLAAYGLLYGFFDRHAWHWPIFRWLGIVTTPDVRGRWLGEQISSFKDANDKHRTSRVIMEVEQSFADVKVTTYYKAWQTTRTISSFMKVDDQCLLFIMFESEPKVTYDGEAAAHKGVARLTQQPDGTLIGTYFNANGQQGELNFRRTMYALHYKFEAITKK